MRHSKDYRLADKSMVRVTVELIDEGYHRRTRWSFFVLVKGHKCRLWTNPVERRCGNSETREEFNAALQRHKLEYCTVEQLAEISDELLETLKPDWSTLGTV